MERKYSIVLTVYNAERFLKQCLDSILNQTYENWELILVNDGSTDNSGEIAREFSNSINFDNTLRNVRYLEHDNSGAVFSRERGICNASGDYIFFIDADDYYDYDLIEKVDDVIEKTNADIIQFGYKFVDEMGAKTTDGGLYQKGVGGVADDYIVDYDNNSFSYKALSICYSLWSRAFKRSLFDTNEGYYKCYYDVNMTNDLLAFSRPLSLANSYCFTDIYPYNYRIVSSSLCHDVSIQKICSYFKSISWAEECLRERNGITKEHGDFFTMRLVNIVFDEYRENIYSASPKDIVRIYDASSAVKNIRNYIINGYVSEEDWYKRLYLKTFVDRKVLLPKVLNIYTNIKNKINKYKINNK